jgi:hypothetical protein
LTRIADLVEQIRPWANDYRGTASVVVDRVRFCAPSQIRTYFSKV